jgi:hypothetical protein
MEDETILVIVILGGIAAMIAGLVVYMRRREARLAAQDRIEIPIYSVWRSVVVILPALVIVPVLAAVAGAMTDPLLRKHALAATLLTIGGGCTSLLLAILATRNFRRIGVLALDAEILELTEKGGRHTLDPRRPFSLFEGICIRSSSVPLQVVLVTQDDRSWAFSYGIALGKKAHGDRALDVPELGPMLGGEARVLHDRLRAQPAMTRDPGSGPWQTADGLLELRDGRWFVSR